MTVITDSCSPIVYPGNVQQMEVNHPIHITHAAGRKNNDAALDSINRYRIFNRGTALQASQPLHFIDRIQAQLPALATSAKTGQGVPELGKVLFKVLMSFESIRKHTGSQWKIARLLKPELVYKPYVD